jgi:hypothetical protein
MSPENEQENVADLVLERYRLGELPLEETERLRRRLDADASTRRRLERLEESDRDIRASGALDRVTAGLRSGGVHPERWEASSRLRRWAVPVVAAAAVVLAVIVVPRRAGPPGGGLPASPAASSNSQERVKGLRPALAVYRRTAAGSEALADGDVVRPGDVVRVGYRAAGRAYGVILSIDGRGAVTLHLPTVAGPAVRLERDATVLLDRAYELDDAPRFERFFFVTAERPFETGAILEAARRAAAGVPDSAVALPLTGEFEQATFSLHKEPRP